MQQPFSCSESANVHSFRDSEISGLSPRNGIHDPLVAPTIKGTCSMSCQTKSPAVVTWGVVCELNKLVFRSEGSRSWDPD